MGVTEKSPGCIVQQSVRKKLHMSEKHGMWNLHMCVKVFVGVCMSLCVCNCVCIYACKWLSVPEQAGAARSCLINAFSSSSSFFAIIFICLWQIVLIWDSPPPRDGVLVFKSVLPQMSQIGWRYQSEESAKMIRALLGLYCPPAHLYSGRTGTAGGFLRCCHLLQLLRPRLQPYSGTALILHAQRGKG